MRNDQTIRCARISIAPAWSSSGQNSGTAPHRTYAPSPYAIPRRSRSFDNPTLPLAPRG